MTNCIRRDKIICDCDPPPIFVRSLDVMPESSKYSPAPFLYLRISSVDMIYHFSIERHHLEISESKQEMFSARYYLAFL